MFVCVCVCVRIRACACVGVSEGRDKVRLILQGHHGVIRGPAQGYPGSLAFQDLYLTPQAYEVTRQELHILSEPSLDWKLTL